MNAVAQAAAVALVVGGLLGGQGCTDPCTQLAARICNCELTETERRSCRTDRITNQSGNVTIDDADKEFCAQKLETCDCAALDADDLDACGFVNDASDGGADSND